MELTDHQRGFKEAFDVHEKILLDLADEAKSDGKHQAYNYLRIAIHRLRQAHGYEQFA